MSGKDRQATLIFPYINLSLGFVLQTKRKLCYFTFRIFFGLIICTFTPGRPSSTPPCPTPSRPGLPFRAALDSTATAHAQLEAAASCSWRTRTRRT